MDQSRKLYIFGGHDGRRSLADLHIFDTESMNWSKAAVSGRPPVAGSRHTTTLAGDKLYVLGASDSGTFRDVHALDIETLTWSPVEAGGQPPIARSRHTSTLVGRNLVVFGGVGGGRPLNDLYVMHAGSLFWTEPPVNGIAPTQRVGHTATLVGTKVFIFGGHDGRVCLNDVHILVTMNWRAVNTKGGRPTPRVGCTMNTVGGKLFLLGGGAGEKAFNDVRVLDLESAVWTVPTVSGTPPAALVGHTSTLIGTELFVFGGSDGKSDGNELHMFDTETLSWSLPSLEGQPPMARVGHSGSAVGATKIYYFGGYGVRLGYVSDTYVLDTALLSWTKPYINGTPPPARIGHASVVIGTKLYVFAGANAGFVLQDMHVLDTTSMSWIEPPTGGLAPGPLFGHTAQPVGRCRSLHATRCHGGGPCAPPHRAPPTHAPSRGRCIFVFGGCSAIASHGGRMSTGLGRVPTNNTIYVLDADTLSWSKPNVAGVTPFPRYRHASAIAGSQMYSFGGFGGGADLYALDTGIMDENKSDRDLSRRRRGGRAGGGGSDQGNELITWLEGLGLGKYTRVFIRQELDFDTLVAGLRVRARARARVQGGVAPGPSPTPRPGRAHSRRPARDGYHRARPAQEARRGHRFDARRGHGQVLDRRPLPRAVHARSDQPGP